MRDPGADKTNLGISMVERIMRLNCYLMGQIGLSTALAKKHWACFGKVDTPKTTDVSMEAVENYVNSYQ
ncbi:hypothetical protein [Paenibacillus sp. 843]|uniref:hypothetical protein n=1 Tax=Paenibacillus sp. 843 TaxID=3341795 RepID=UPI00372D4442